MDIENWFSAWYAHHYFCTRPHCICRNLNRHTQQLQNYLVYFKLEVLWVCRMVFISLHAVGSWFWLKEDFQHYFQFCGGSMQIPSWPHWLQENSSQKYFMTWWRVWKNLVNFWQNAVDIWTDLGMNLCPVFLFVPETFTWPPVLNSDPRCDTWNDISWIICASNGCGEAAELPGGYACMAKFDLDAISAWPNSRKYLRKEIANRENSAFLPRRRWVFRFLLRSKKSNKNQRKMVARKSAQKNCAAENGGAEVFANSSQIWEGGREEDP